LCVYVQPCEINNSSKLICIIPVLELPEEFRNLSDPSLVFPYNNESVSSSQRAAYRRYNDSDTTYSELDFKETVLLDGYTYRWWNESFKFQFISLLPTIIDTGPHDFNSTLLNIQVGFGTCDLSFVISQAHSVVFPSVRLLRVWTLVVCLK